jgi:hypothetical protein
VIVRKRPQIEIDRGGRLPSDHQPAAEQRIYYNQYRNDHEALKSAKMRAPLFGDESDL